MPKVILHGGYTGFWEQAGCDLPLFQKLVDAAREADGKIMISFCAHEKPEDFPHLEEMLATLREIAPDVQIVIAGRDNFHELLPQHQILFLQGGRSEAHRQFMSNVTKEKLIDGKYLVAGSSSGAMLLCNWGYSRSSGGPFQGKGIVDIALMPHANTWEVEKFLSELRQASSSSTLLLNEMQMVELTA